MRRSDSFTMATRTTGNTDQRSRWEIVKAEEIEYRGLARQFRSEGRTSSLSRAVRVLPRNSTATSTG
jgi:hypothetical protein